MKTFRIVTAAIICMSVATPAVAEAGRATQLPRVGAKRTLEPFRSERELKAYFAELAEAQKRQRLRLERLLREQERLAGQRRLRELRKLEKEIEELLARSTLVETITVSAEAPKVDASTAATLTNVQHGGVDEGGIVKRHGDYLVVLRRGRLFTIAIGDGELRPVAAVDAFAPDIAPERDDRATWYDELLVSGDTIAVVGYSYQRGGTEIGLFDIDAAGNLTYRATYHLRSDDYYSRSNYASRLIGTRLIVYAPLRVRPEADPMDSLPALRKWHAGAEASEFRLISTPTRIFRSAQPFDTSRGVTLHTMTACDLATADLACEATVVIGPPPDAFYISPASLYVWSSDNSPSRTRVRSVLYRVPLDGSAVTALQVSGDPVDQFSFLESNDGHLNVVVLRHRDSDPGLAGFTDVAVSLVRIPIDSFSDGSVGVPATQYRSLTRINLEVSSFHNRFAGEHLLLGTSRWSEQTLAESSLFVTRWAGREMGQLPLVHGVDRIELMGPDAIVIGSSGAGLHFTAIRLGAQPRVVSTFARSDASQSEDRSHGFFYHLESDTSGILGLPILRPGTPERGEPFAESASIVFVRNQSLQLAEAGELAANPEVVVDDDCRVSCVDWYGNARPLFIDRSIFGLLGYEIVEGTIVEGRLRETRRVNFQPRSGQRR